MTERESLAINLQQQIGISDDAVAFLMDLWDTVQALDDLVDGDEVDAGEAKESVFSWARYQMNPFFSQYQASLGPQIALMAIKWGVSDTVERLGQADARSYMWRAGYYDVVALVVLLDCGFDHDKAMMVFDLYGETLDEYMREFGA